MRARIYIGAGGFRHGVVGLTMLILPWLYAGAAFVPIFNLIPLTAWGWIMTVTGLVCVAAAVVRNGNIARVGIVCSAVITLVLAAGLTIGIAAVWMQWTHAIGWGRLVALFWDHPVAYPDYLRAVTPLTPPSPFLPLIMLAFTVKDFTMCAQPLRVPLEERMGDRRLRTT